jgi:alkanesulfonate monooxygenase SsuD/methylene tetrahydromethanopterin reductase-like flavin-dependent oxidoreductase (luciferase family)
MHFGVFIEELRPGAGQADAFRESLETVDAAETLGLDCVWLGEIHFNPARSVISSPIAMATAIAARTKRIPVGTAVQVLPLNHSLRIAEDAQLIERLIELRDELGLDGVVVEPNPAGLIPTDYAAQTLSIVARDAMPAFK